VGRIQPIAQIPAGLGAQVNERVRVLWLAFAGVGDRRRDAPARQAFWEVAADPELVERDLVVRYVPLAPEKGWPLLGAQSATHQGRVSQDPLPTLSDDLLSG
jgi:hypothetical protein